MTSVFLDNASCWLFILINFHSVHFELYTPQVLLAMGIQPSNPVVPCSPETFFVYSHAKQSRAEYLSGVEKQERTRRSHLLKQIAAKVSKLSQSEQTKHDNFVREFSVFTSIERMELESLKSLKQTYERGLQMGVHIDTDIYEEKQPRLRVLLQKEEMSQHFDALKAIVSE